MARLALLWHLHQPDYRDPASGRPVMPWVRLHALRGYRDVILESVEREVACTINLVPSLVDQLLAYSSGVDDDHLALTRIAAEDLGAEQRETIARTFVVGNAAMHHASPAYARLAAQVHAGGALSTAVIRDLQVWSTLAWFGATALRDYPELVALRRKGSQFSEVDKEMLLRAQGDLLKEIPSWFQRLGSSKVAVSATPYYHPILPLLVNTAHARRCLPEFLDEAKFSWPSDARLQLVRGRARIAEIIGRTPIGCWPSEGSVSPETVELIREAGFRWFATDEGILRRSVRQGDGNGPWRVGGCVGFFRDQPLSDRLGFDIARQEPRQAAQQLAGEAQRRGGLVVVALDGENPWEAFEDAGGAFRAALYAQLEDGPARGMTLDEAAEAAPVGTVTSLHTGSWIGANFGVWYGHPDDRAAWRLLALTRQAIEHSPEPNRSAALEKLLPAQGSDWMWWYGDEFSTPFAGTFDALFRAHVRAAWQALGKTPPPEVERPLASDRGASIEPPSAWIDPDQGTPNWARWAGAGRLHWPPQGAMARALDPIRFGWDEERTLWLWIPPLDGGRWDGNGERVFSGDEGEVWRCSSEEIEVGRPGGPVGRWTVKREVPWC